MLYAVLLRYLMTLNVIDGAVFSIVMWMVETGYIVLHSPFILQE